MQRKIQRKTGDIRRPPSLLLVVFVCILIGIGILICICVLVIVWLLVRRFSFVVCFFHFQSLLTKYCAHVQDKYDRKIVYFQRFAGFAKTFLKIFKFFSENLLTILHNDVIISKCSRDKHEMRMISSAGRAPDS